MRSGVPEEMLACVLHGKEDVRLERVPVPKPQAGELLVREGLRPGDAKRAKESMMRILASTLSEENSPLPPIPRAPKKARSKKVKKTQKPSTGTSRR